MKKRLFPGTNLECSVLGLGTWGLGGPNPVGDVPLGWRPLDEKEAVATVRAAFDAGINFFDSSDFYGMGRSEELLGRSLRDVSDRVVIATKVGIVPAIIPGTDDLARDFSPAHIARSVESSLRRLRREHIDLYQLHGPAMNVLARDECWAELERLRLQGKIRYIGVSLRSSHMQGQQLERWLSCPFISSIQLDYSIEQPGRLMHLERCSLSLPVIARSIFRHGLLLKAATASVAYGSNDHRSRKVNDGLVQQFRNFADLARTSCPDRSLIEALLKLAMSCRSIAVTLVGATSPTQVAEITAAISSEALATEERALLLKASAAVFGSQEEAPAS